MNKDEFASKLSEFEDRLNDDLDKRLNAPLSQRYHRIEMHRRSSLDASATEAKDTDDAGHFDNNNNSFPVVTAAMRAATATAPPPPVQTRAKSSSIYTRRRKESYNEALRSARQGKGHQTNADITYMPARRRLSATLDGPIETGSPQSASSQRRAVVKTLLNNTARKTPKDEFDNHERSLPLSHALIQGKKHFIVMGWAQLRLMEYILCLIDRERQRRIDRITSTIPVLR